MNKNIDVIIFGAGAMGGAFASKFYDHNPDSIAFLASGKRHTDLSENGLSINGKVYPIQVVHPDEEITPPKLIIVALKHHHLESAIPEMSRIVGEDTIILSVMNGLDSEKIISEAVGPKKLVLAISVGIDAQRVDGQISFSHLGKIIFGEADNRHLSEKVLKVQHILRKADIPYHTPEDMIRMLWWKFMINVGINQPSALLSAPYRTFQTSSHAQAIMEATMLEVIAVAQAEGVDLSEKDMQDWYGVLHNLDPDGLTSMAQDIEAGRQTEVEIFAGKMINLGKKHHIPTPMNEFLYHSLYVLQEAALKQNLVCARLKK